jgi:hypothetical protein
LLFEPGKNLMLDEIGKVRKRVRFQAYSNLSGNHIHLREWTTIDLLGAITARFLSPEQRPNVSGVSGQSITAEYSLQQ